MILFHLIFYWPIFPIFSSFTILPSILPLLLLVQLLSATYQTILLLSLSYCATISQLWRIAHLLSQFLIAPPFVKEPSPLSQAMNPPQNHPTPREGVYNVISVGEIVNIPSSIKKTLIHRGISLNSLPSVSFLKYSFAHEKYWWFLAAKLIMYPSNFVLTHKLIAHVTGRSSRWSFATLYVSQVQVFLTHSWNSRASWSLSIKWKSYFGNLTQNISY